MKYAPSGKTLLELVDDSRIELVFNLSFLQLDQARPGTEASVVVAICE